MKLVETTPGVARGVVALAGVWYLLAGAALLVAPLWFYRTLGDFGPYNQHYEGDVGAFLLPLGLGLLLAARQPFKHPLLLWVGALGSLLHTLNHLYADLIGQPSVVHLLGTTLPLLLLAALLLWVALRGAMQARVAGR